MSDTLNWKLDEALIESIQEALAAPDANGDVSTLELLEGIGTLVYAGAKEQVDAIVQVRGEQLGVESIKSALAQIDVEQLEDASIELSRLLIELTDAEPDQRDALCDRVAVLLSVRDKLELGLAGAEEVLGHTPDMDVELESAIDAFDELLEPELWRTVVLGERRWARVAWAHPKYRNKMWWWSKGADVASDAVESLKTTASLVAAFPTAQEELEVRQAAEKSFSKLVAPAATSKVVSILDYLAQKRDERMETLTAPVGQIRVAAAPEDDDLLILTTSELEVSTSGEYLNIDRVGEIGTDEEMSAVISVEGHDDLVAESPFPGRVRFPLSASQFKGISGKLTVEWGGAKVELTLPFDEEGQ